MNMGRCKTWLLLLVVTVMLLPLTTCKKPNILVLIADDLGIGDIGCFGNTTLRTPNIDSIARDGALLSQHLSAASLCSPSRAALLTGRYPARSGMAPNTMIRVSLFNACPYGLPTSEITFAKLAKQAGYKTGLIGKWHQGWSRDSFNDFHHHPRNHGFDYFYGIPLTNLKDFGDDGDRVLFSFLSHALNRFITVVLVLGISTICLHRAGYIGIMPCSLIIFLLVLISGSVYLIMDNLKLLNSTIYRNFDLVEQPIDLETQMAKEVAEGQEFLQARRNDGEPFLLVMSWVHVHVFLAPAQKFLGKSKHGKYGDSVEEMDWAVGEMLNSLQQLGFADNTLVYFTSDHGGHLEERNVRGELEGGYNGIYKGGKGHGAVDGGIRVPTVIKWPGRIRAGSTSSEPTSQMDVLPTLANAMGVPIPSDRRIDGHDMLPLLTGQTSVSSHDFMFHYCGSDVHAVRYRPRGDSIVWKLTLKEPNYLPGRQVCEFVCNCAAAITLEPPHLYDMTSDPGEKQPMNATDHPQVYKKMMHALEEHVQNVKPVPNQYTFRNVMWRPWLQMCCNNNYPSCTCQDDKFKGKF
ncbi:steryl-sulfatase-like [Haliotis cracherodii]|uniref:steryl-sulfatase-like n=1 Tax=Haliotis cracherodii TaxID=6455 RepID=UPI0039E91CF6